MGVYLYCCVCICTALGISKSRLSRQRHIKRQLSQNPLVETTKAQVEEKRLGDYIIMPDGVESSFNVWWWSLSASTIVTVRFPYTRHGNAGKAANSAKKTVMDDFLLI